MKLLQIDLALTAYPMAGASVSLEEVLCRKAGVPGDLPKRPAIVDRKGDRRLKGLPGERRQAVAQGFEKGE